MSYCRWSSNDFACDLYVYQDTRGGWTIHVAANRVVGKIPPVVWPVDDSPEAIDRFAASQRAQHEFLLIAERAPIGLPHDGETFRCWTAAACADEVERLIGLGYRTPSYVAQDLRLEEEP